MTTQTKEVKRPNSDRMHEIEHKHFGQCLDQLWGQGRRTLIELMDWPKAGPGKRAILVKQFESPAPKPGSGRDWPDLMSCYVFTEIDDEKTMTWDGLDAALASREPK